MQEDGPAARSGTGSSGRVDGRIVGDRLRRGLRCSTTSTAPSLRSTRSPTSAPTGYGAAMLARCEQVARERGRTTVLGDVSTGRTPRHPTATASRRRVRRGRTATRWRSSRSSAGSTCRRGGDARPAGGRAPPPPRGYTLRSWVGPGARGAPRRAGPRSTSALMTEAPTGEIDREPETAGPGRGPRGARRCASSRAASSTPPRPSTPTATVVAYTDLGVNTDGPPRAYQWGTLVRREHRGHRLGLAVKVANLRQLQRERPDLGQVDHLQRRGQRPHDRRQRRHGLRAGRAARARCRRSCADGARRAGRSAVARAPSVGVERLSRSSVCSSPSRSQVTVTLSPGR